MQERLFINLSALMEHHRINAAQLARLTNIPLSTLKNIRNGSNTNPTIGTLLPLVQYFNISLEDLIYGDPKLSAKHKVSHVQKTLPVLSWEEALDWPQITQHKYHIFTERNCSKSSFALPLEQDFGPFIAPGIYLVDPQADPSHFDYVLLQKAKLKIPFIKQLIVDEESAFIRSLNVDRLTALDNHYRILGVIFEYRQEMKHDGQLGTRVKEFITQKDVINKVI